MESERKKRERESEPFPFVFGSSVMNQRRFMLIVFFYITDEMNRVEFICCINYVNATAEPC